MKISSVHKYHYVYYSYESWGRGYIGVRSCKCPPKEDNRYFGTYRDKSFKPTNKIILAEFDSREAAQKAEIELHAFFNVDINSHFANRARARTTGFSCGYTRRISEETKRKIGEANKKALKGRKLPEEVKVKIGAHFKGKPKSLEHREKIKNAQVGKKFSEEHLKNLRIALNNRQLTSEQRHRLGEVHRKKTCLRDLATGEVYTFSSRSEAASVLGIGASTIGNAIRRGQKKVHNYEICDTL